MVEDLHPAGGGMFLEVFAIIGDLCQALGFDEMKAEGKRHFTKTVMMAVTFPVGCDMDQLGPLPGVMEGREQPGGKGLAVFQQTSKGNVLGDRSIVEEGVDCF